MGKKSVQAVYTTRTTLGISGLYTQVVLIICGLVGKSGVQSKALRPAFHMSFEQFFQRSQVFFYTVPTGPTITTICIKNKNHINQSFKKELTCAFK